MKHGNTRKLLAAGAAALAVGLGACGTSGTATTSAPEATTTVAKGAIEVTGVWGRATAPGAKTSAIYAEIKSTGEADALVGVTVPADIAAEAQLHITTTEMQPGDMQGGDMTSSSTMAPDMSGSAGHSMGGDTSTTMAGGHTGMQQVPKFDIPAGGTLTLAPGGNHIMLIGLAKQLVAGDSYTATLQFEKAPAQTINVQVRDS